MDLVSCGPTTADIKRDNGVYWMKFKLGKNVDDTRLVAPVYENEEKFDEMLHFDQDVEEQNQRYEE